MQKKKSGVKKCLEICAVKGGVGRLMANAILNFHFDYPHTSLRKLTKKHNFGAKTAKKVSGRGAPGSGPVCWEKIRQFSENSKWKDALQS